jgi:dipeptidase
LIYSTVAPSLKNWPQRRLSASSGPRTISNQKYEGEGAAFYPFSVKPEKKLSVKDIIAFQRSVFENTVYDMMAHPGWLVPEPGGISMKSPLATPFASLDLMKLLGITRRRTIATQGYGMVAQLRVWLPDSIGGVYWFYVDNPYVSTYVPIYAGVQEISPLYKTYDFKKFSDDSARWAVDFVEKLLSLRWQSAVKDLQEARDPLEAGFFSEQPEIEEKALKFYKKDPMQAKKFLTDLTRLRMEKIVQMYRDLRHLLITKYSGDTL